MRSPSSEHSRHLRRRDAWPTLRRTLAIVAVAIGGASCTSTATSDPTGGGIVTADPLTTAMALWNAKKPGGDSYVMVQRIVCTCTTQNIAYRFTVTGTTISNVVNDRTDDSLPVAQWGVFKTVAQLFSAVQTAQTQTSVLKLVTYDANLGYPSTLSLDPNPAATGDEISYVTSSVSAVP